MPLLGYIAAVGAIRQERRFNVIANNLTNAQTTGFKKDLVVFRAAIEEATGKTRQELGSTVTSYRQGDLETTGNPLDLAIEGEGFFKVATPHGVRYSRAGNFRLNSEKILVNSNGFAVLGRAGEITINGKEIKVEGDGSIRVDGSITDQIAVVSFRELGALKKEGSSLLRLEVPQDELLPEQSRVIQGALESSNVSIVEEMTGMIDALRIYESCIKLIQSNDELNVKAITEVGRV